MDRGPVNAAVLALLAAGLDPVPVGDGQVPLGYPQRNKAHVIVYSIPGGGFDGPTLTGPESEPEFVYQITVVGWRPDQAQQVADVARSVMVGRAGSGAFLHPLAVSGAYVKGRLTDTTPGGIDQQDEMFVIDDRYRIALSPA